MSAPHALPYPWSALADRLGGAAALARSLGTGRTQLHRWATGRAIPSAIVQSYVNSIFRRRGLPVPFAVAA